MGLGSEFSVLQSIDDNEIVPHEEMGILGESETKLNSNGGYHVEDVNLMLLEEIKTRGNTVGSASPGGNKRPGLRKWRRIPRELAKKTGSNVDGRNGDFTASPVVKAMVNVNDGSGCVDGPVFGTRADSMNSEDQSSRSSSDPGIKHDDQQRHGQIGPGKKARGFNTDKENSNSTMGSDSRSSNFVFVQGSNTVASKGRQQISTFAKYDEESSDDAHFADKRLNEVSDDVSQEDLAADNVEKHESSLDQDLLVESINALHFAQEEFEREVQKWRDVEKDDQSTFGGLIQEILDLKDAKIFELESTLNSGECMNELDDCLMKIIQAEVEYVVITTTTKSLTEGPLHAIKLDRQQASVSSKDSQPTKKQEEKLETKEDLKKLHNRVCRCTSYFIIQVILLLVAIYLMFVPKSVEVVPT